MSENDSAETDGDEEDWFESAISGDDTGDAAGASDTGTWPSDDAGDAVDDSDFESAFGADADAAETEPESDFGVPESGPADEGADDGVFEDDFAAEMASLGGPEESDEFDEDLDTDIPRLDVGIDGLDEMIQGGVPERHLMVAVGGPGTGKTTLGLQFIQHGLAEADENAVFITLEQTYDDIMSTAEERDWAFERYEAENRLAVIDLDPVEMATSLDNIRGELPRLVEEFDADRFVLDSVSLLEMMYDDPATRRTEIFDFTQSLKRAGVTTLLTSEASEGNPYASRHGVIEYLTDAVFILQYVRSEASETRTAIEIQKIRNANHSRQTKPYEITLDGISVYSQADIF